MFAVLKVTVEVWKHKWTEVVSLTKGKVLAFVFIFHIHSFVSVSYFTVSSTSPDKKALSGMKYREKLKKGSLWRNMELAFIISDKSMVMYLQYLL